MLIGQWKARFVGLCCVLLVLPAASGCDWDRYDPRLVEDGGTGGQGDDSMCGRIEMLADDFESAEPAELWSDHVSGAESSATQAGGELVVVTGPGEYDVASFVSRHFYDFRDGAVAVEVTQLPLDTTDVTTQLVVQRDDTTRVMLQQRGLDLRFVRQVNSAEVLGTVTYDATAHRWWRLRNDDETMLWETSPDGAIWTVQQEHPLSGLFDLDYARVRLQIHENAAAGGEAHFDNLKSSGPGDGVWCPTATLTDDFSEETRADHWLHTNIYHAFARQYQGRLVASLVPDQQYARAEYVASRRYDMTGGGLSFELVRAPKPPAIVTLHASSTEGESIEMTLAEELISCTFHVESAGTEVASIDYLPAEHRWWRIREADDTLIWEASPDGLSWEQLALQSPNPLILDRMTVRFGLSTTGEHPPTSGQAIFDNFNLMPAP